MALLAVAAMVAALGSVAASSGVAGGADGGASSSAGPVSSSSYSPALAFADTEHSVLPMTGLLARGVSPEPDPARPGSTAGLVASWEHGFFSDLEMEPRAGTNPDLAFAVESQPDRSLYPFCKRGGACHDLKLEVNSRGLLYLRNPDTSNFGFATLHWSAAFPQQRLEVSAADPGTGMKVYREVLINPPQEEPGCEDYADFTVDAYVCLFLRQRIPEGAAGSSDEATLRAGLPGLVQDKSNYELVFAEEFNGTPPSANAAGCRDGVSTLNGDVWNYVDTCAWVDSRGEACSNVADGSFYAAVAYKCGTNLNTFGKLHYQYGYLEFKYTLNMDGWNWSSNQNLVAWAPAYPEQHLWSQYGVTIDSWEDYLKYVSVELDFLEYVAQSRHSSWGMHANWGRIVSNVRSYRTGVRLDYCPTTRIDPYRVLSNPNPCRTTDTFTVTLGVEWTPRGYRTFVKWDTIQDELTVWPKRGVGIDRQLPGGPQTHLQGTARDRYFEYLTPGNTSTILTQAGVGHSPNPIGIGAFGDDMPSSMNHIRTKVKFDYVRLWQPQDHYSNMEPVYQ
ncbi:MAG: hypothetical protein F4Y99_09125 [Acidimicrobiaceae bacterium]|nr:hypothetical protein [Acidimicrobiaceae bacterium]MYF43563.1 hypothetical protein [Acidimicrobiaceae bacterium]MYJ36430.1 hypothetical protein [Acidimicrobiaceae bacterium]